MMDTQETNLPNEITETGKLEESQAPEEKPVETKSEAEVIPEDTAPKAEIIPEEPSTPEVVAETIVSEETIPDVETVSDAGDAETVPKVDSLAATVLETDQTDSEEAIPEEAAVMTEPDVEVEENEEQSLSGEAEAEDGDKIELLDSAALASLTKIELIECLKKIAAEPKKYVRSEVDMLKQAYYKIRRDETEAKKKEFLEEGGEEQHFVAPEDETETQLRALIADYKEKRASITANEERQKEANLILKQHLIERLKILTESQDDFNRRYNEFRDIQRKWKEIRLIPQEYSRELWRSYQLYNERFYDIVKINNQFRDYDFKKNLEMKTILCETVERLSKESDVISAFHQLQKLHQQWREIGPVSKDFRESIWDRFKAASTLVNKRHQSHFDNLKRQEEKNLLAKEELCKEAEEINFEALKTLKDWERKTKDVEGMQKKWRTIGFATKKHNAKIFERFCAVTDNYFNKKSEFYKSVKHDMDKNLELKKALIEKAESMKNNTDWKETTKAFIEIQNEWKKIGPVARKYSEVIWKQFISTCDYFFEQKGKETSSQKSEEQVNLEAKKALIEKIKSIDPDLSDEEALSLLRQHIAEWNTIGYVPFKEKDKLHKAFRDSVDKQFDRLKVNERDRRIQQFRSNLTEFAGAGVGKNKLYNERDRLMRTYDRMKNEIQTYENNIGFISSKGGDGLLKEMERKIAHLKEEMEIVVKKIEAIDENLD